MISNFARFLHIVLPFAATMACLPLVRAQDLAPASVTNMVYVTSQDVPGGESSSAPLHSGALAIDGNCYPINVSKERNFTVPSPYTWTKTGPTTGVLAHSAALPQMRLEITFELPLRGTYRQTSTGATSVTTGRIEFAELPRYPVPPIVNLSTRMSLARDKPAISGFVVEGPAARRVLIRGIGPALARFGVANAAPRPALTVYQGNTVLAENSGWGGTTPLKTAFSAVGAFSLEDSSADCAVLLTLAPGSYSAHVRAPDGGEILLEVYYVE